MSIGALDAASAYGRVQGLGSALGSSSAPKVGGSDNGGGFGSMVESLVTGTAQQMRTAEHASAMQVAGKGDLIDVVTAIGAAETALDTMVAVRDRVVGAYTDIMRMQI
ncbi:flagellar hook-basal body complex protein FliE [Sphingomonas sp. IC-56]|uniref:flagellar hook-basal body complex protein FliE n=1 Tax=Sphingomonas sp. IC-56 TaxID=2898529 RepID=UPI001E619CB4|nr:flagellar hook-basal body complex protein FliE [Sphingomonas sp. IC-56]MCD2324243.1 flagellar hook-basal body complex protein FliE [Sphingomonas sp. IC-56]